MNGTQVSVLKQTDKVGFTCFLLKKKKKTRKCLLNLEETLSMLYVTLQYSHGIISNIIATHLKCTNGCTLEPQISFEVLCDLPNQTLKRQLADEQLCWLLITTNLSQSNSSRPKVGGEKKVWFTYHHYKLYLSCMCNCASHYTASQTHLYLWGFLTPPVEGALFLAALVASCFLGAFPPVDLRAVCLVRAIVSQSLEKIK